MARIVIVGGGVIGCAAAERLTRDGHQVILLERDRIGAHASGAAAGLLAPYSEGEEGTGEQSLALFPELAERLELETGIDVEYRAGESISPALDESEEAALKSAAEYKGRWVDGVEARRLEPALHPAARGAAIFPESQVTPPRLTTALAIAAAKRGGTVREGALVTGFEIAGDSVHAVRLFGEKLGADFVVLAAGPWTAALAAPHGIDLAVWPSRGQLVRLRPSGTALARMLTWRGRYLVPKPDGRVVAGSTEEAAGFDARVTAEGVEGLLRFARSAVPVLARATVEEVWAALRPATADGKPVIGPAPGIANLLLATGHNRNGILLAPITAERLASSIGRK